MSYTLGRFGISDISILSNIHFDCVLSWRQLILTWHHKNVQKSLEALITRMELACLLLYVGLAKLFWLTGNYDYMNRATLDTKFCPLFSWLRQLERSFINSQCNFFGKSFATLFLVEIFNFTRYGNKMPAEVFTPPAEKKIDTSLTSMYNF